MFPDESAPREKLSRISGIQRLCSRRISSCGKCYEIFDVGVEVDASNMPFVHYLKVFDDRRGGRVLSSGNPWRRAADAIAFIEKSLSSVVQIREGLLRNNL